MLQFHVWYHITTHQHKIVFKKSLLKQKINNLNQQFKVTVFLTALKVNKSRTPTARKDFLLLKPTGHTWQFYMPIARSAKNCQVCLVQQWWLRLMSDQNIKPLISGMSDWYISHFPLRSNLKQLANTYASKDFE